VGAEEKEVIAMAVLFHVMEEMVVWVVMIVMTV
jgi:hypothetical protein